MSTWQISCTQKGVLRKMTLKDQKVEIKYKYTMAIGFLKVNLQDKI